MIKAFCNHVAIEKGLDPAGSAGHFEDAVVMERSFPWKRDYASMGLPAEMMKLLELWMQRYRETGVYGHRPLFIAPDEDYSKEGYRRVTFYTRPQMPFAEFTQTEYLVPEAEMGALIWAWYEAPETLSKYESYRQDANHRDILVCTHGAVDAACAKFGYPLYKHLRQNCASENLRVWRVSHFGGHVFAPTLMDMPKGDYWAYVEIEQGEQILRREGDIRQLYKHYRGWAGFEMGFLQAAESECLMLEGWEWQQIPKTGRILAQEESENPQWAELEINGYRFRVEQTASIELIHTSNQDKTYAYPQYTAKLLETVS
jgi:hypothetical protein